MPDVSAYHQGTGIFAISYISHIQWWLGSGIPVYDMVRVPEEALVETFKIIKLAV